MKRETQDGGIGSRPLPILLLVGPHGAGKTSFLAELADSLHGRIPYARLDFAANPEITPRQVLTFVVFELNRWCADYGRLAFRRFLVGELVSSLDLAAHDRDRARARNAVKQALEEYRQVDKLKGFLQVLASEAAKTMPAAATAGALPGKVPTLETAVAYFPGLLLDGLVRLPVSRRFVLGRAAEWYANRPGRPAQDMFDALVDLNRFSRNGNADERAIADETIWAAFLADMGDQFGTTRSVHKRPRFCPILLDNVDARAGWAFLERFIQVRRSYGRAGQDEPGPLLIVATSRRPPARAVAPIDPEHASHPDWMKRVFSQGGTTPDDESWWYPVALRGLTPSELQDLLAVRRVPDARRNAVFLHRLTGGHAHASTLLAGALADLSRGLHAGRIPAARARSVLAVSAPESASGTFAAYLLDRLLVGVDRELLDLLITCSAARHLGEAAQLMLTRVRRELLQDIQAYRDWTIRDANGHQALHPLPRRLLLAELAARDPAHTDSWDNVHRGLAEQCKRLEDPDGALYHDLAREEVPNVVATLKADLEQPETRPGSWSARLAAVTAAPNQLAADRPPMTSVAELSKWVDPADVFTASLARLTVARWIQSDPLGDPYGELHRVIANEYRSLAPFSRSRFEEFMTEADRHDQIGADGE